MKVNCEICGSDLIKQDNYYTCSKCGLKYSVDDIISKMSIVQSNLSLEKLDTYMYLISKEKNRGNYEEALEYCNKALDIDLNFYPAWFQKGIITLSIGQLTGDKVLNGFGAFSNALDFCCDSEREKLEKYIIWFLQYFTKRNISEALKYYETSMPNTDTNKVIDLFAIFLMFNGKYLKEKLRLSVNTDEIYMLAWENFSETLNNIWTKHIHDPAEKLKLYDGTRGEFIRELAANFLTIQSVYIIYMTDCQFYCPQEYYKRRIILLELAADRADYIIDNSQYVDSICAELRKFNSTQLRDISNTLKQAQIEIDIKEKNEKIDKYWKENLKEKKQLEEVENVLNNEINVLLSKIKILQEEIDTMPEKTKMNTILNEISCKESITTNLGFFNKKKKKELQDEIVKLKVEFNSLSKLKDAKELDVKNKVNKLKLHICTNEEKRKKLLSRLLDPIDNCL